MSENQDGSRKGKPRYRRRASRHQKASKAQREKDEQLFARVDRRDRKSNKKDDTESK